MAQNNGFSSPSGMTWTVAIGMILVGNAWLAPHLAKGDFDWTVVHSKVMVGTAVVMLVAALLSVILIRAPKLVSGPWPSRALAGAALLWTALALATVQVRECRSADGFHSADDMARHVSHFPHDMPRVQRAARSGLRVFYPPRFGGLRILRQLASDERLTPDQRLALSVDVLTSTCTAEPHRCQELVCAAQILDWSDAPEIIPTLDTLRQGQCTPLQTAKGAKLYQDLMAFCGLHKAAVPVMGMDLVQKANHSGVSSLGGVEAGLLASASFEAVCQRHAGQCCNQLVGLATLFDWSERPAVQEWIDRYQHPSFSAQQFDEHLAMMLATKAIAECRLKSPRGSDQAFGAFRFAMNLRKRKGAIDKTRGLEILDMALGEFCAAERKCCDKTINTLALMSLSDPEMDKVLSSHGYDGKPKLPASIRPYLNP